VNRVLTDGHLHDLLIEAGVDRVADFALDKSAARFAAAIADVVDCE
jgi:hypothetical protein